MSTFDLDESDFFQKVRTKIFILFDILSKTEEDTIKYILVKTAIQKQICEIRKLDKSVNFETDNLRNWEM